MTSQLGRHYRSPARPWPGDHRPPAPGQAYFGYPQPAQPLSGRSAAEQLGVPAQTRRPTGGSGSSAAPVTRPTPIVPQSPPTLAPIRPAAPLTIETAYYSTQPRPYRAHSSARSSITGLYLVGYLLAAGAGGLIGAFAVRLIG